MNRSYCCPTCSASVARVVEAAVAEALKEAAKAKNRFVKAPPPEPVTVEPIETAALRHIRADLAGGSEDLMRFFETLFTRDRLYRTARELAYDLAVPEQTLGSRFWRTGVPTTKEFVAWAFIIRVTRALEEPKVSLNAVCERFGVLSHVFQRTVRTYTGLTVSQLRRQHTGLTMLALFRERLILACRDDLLLVRPLVGTPHLRRANRHVPVARPRPNGRPRSVAA